MDNPLKLITLVWHSKRPSHIKQMNVLRNNFWLKKGYSALTFFGTVVTASDADTEAFKMKGSIMRNHENIHLRQAQTTHDSWLLFYLLYSWYYILALPQNLKMKNAAYLVNPFEMEAYGHQKDMHYLDLHEATEWKKWAAMKPSERRTVYERSLR